MLTSLTERTITEKKQTQRSADTPVVRGLKQAFEKEILANDRVTTKVVVPTLHGTQPSINTSTGIQYKAITAAQQRLDGVGTC
jgi:hypothetical protein